MKRDFRILIQICSCMVFSVLFVTSCKDKENTENTGISTDVVNNPASANGDSTDKNLPKFLFNEESHDFGTIKAGEKVSYNFKFKNSGGSDLVIANAHASCGCTVPEYPKQPIASGGEGTITVTFDSSGKHGKVSKTVTITSNTVPNTKVLTITCIIE